MTSQGQVLPSVGAIAALAVGALFSALGGIAGCGSTTSSGGGTAAKPGAGGTDAGRGGTSGSAGAVNGSAGRGGFVGSDTAGEGSGGDVGGRTTGSSAGGAPVDPCPQSVPVNGSACTVGYQCVYYDCDGVGQVNAFCNGKVITEVLPCASIACGSGECQPGSICVERMGGMTVECQPNPCGQHALSCGCAGSLCMGAETCTVTVGGIVQCDY